MLLYPDPLCAQDLLPPEVLLFSDSPITVTDPPPTAGQEPAELAKLVIERKPPWAEKFMGLFSTAKAEHRAFREAMRALVKMPQSIQLLACRFGSDIANLEPADELLAATGLGLADAGRILSGSHVAALFFRHLSEQYVSFDKDINLLYAACDRLFLDNRLESLLLRIYLTRLAGMNCLASAFQRHNLLLTNPGLLPFLAQLPVESTSPHAHDSAWRALAAWSVFRHLIRPKLGPLNAETMGKIEKLRRDKHWAVRKLRERCHLLSEQLDPQKTGNDFAASIERLVRTQTSKEMGDLFDLDRKHVRDFWVSLFSDKSTWLGISSTLGALWYGQVLVTAAAAVVALSTVGANAFKAAADRREKLRQSDFALLYFLER